MYRTINGYSMKKITIVLIVFFLSLASPTYATNYWVDTSGGAANWAACAGESDVGAGNRCTLAQANAGADDDHVVNIKAGTYNTAIAPANSGTAGHLITYQAVTGETVNIQPGANTSCLNLVEKSYVKVNGITFTFTLTGSTTGYLIQMENGSSYNEISYCTFDGGTDPATTYDISSAPMTPVLRSAGGSACTHNWIHHNTFKDYAFFQTDSCDDKAVGLYIGTTTDQASNNNTIENNIMYHGGHHLFEVYTKYNVIRNNILHNEGWLEVPAVDCSGTWGAPADTHSPRNGKFGNRNLQIYEHLTTNGLYNLFEGNRTGHAAATIDGGQEGNITIAGGKNIVRHNYSFYSETFGIALKNSNATYNRIYNNTLYYNGQDSQTYPDAWTGFGALDWRGGLGCGAGLGTDTSNIAKNNLIYGSYGNRDIMDISSSSCTGRLTASNNWTTANGDPLFNDTDVTDATSTTKPGLQLTTLSPTIDGGTYLTQANGASVGESDTSLVVDDSTYFQCGSACATTPLGSSLSSIAADYICVGTVSNCVQISDINHSTNTITLASALTWEDNANVWLQKKSDGDQVLYGTAPDYGAHEYLGYNLALTISGTGTCTVTSSPAGVNSTVSTTYNYNDGTVVTLTATPAGGSTFAGWSGTDCSGSSTCVVTMSAARDGTATCNITGGATGSMATGTTGSVGISASGTGSITIVP